MRTHRCTTAFFIGFGSSINGAEQFPCGGGRVGHVHLLRLAGDLGMQLGDVGLQQLQQLASQVDENFAVLCHDHGVAVQRFFASPWIAQQHVTGFQCFAVCLQ